MINHKEKLLNKAYLYGFDIHKLKSTLKGMAFYKKDKKEFIKQKGTNSDFPIGKSFPILNEKFEESGNMTGHYFHQDLYVARELFKDNPKKHLDIGSRTDGFVAHVACYREIEVMDIRPQNINIENITFKQADLMILPEELIDAYDSISSLHVIEHFGLGRYGDPIDYNGHIKAIKNITKMLRKGGKFYFSTPIGIQRVEFNAHRVFSVKYLIDLFKKDFEIQRFSLVNDSGNIEINCPLDEESVRNKYNFQYGCGIFELIKN